MQTVITYYKNLTRWDIKSYLCPFSSPYAVEELGKYIYEHSEKKISETRQEKNFQFWALPIKLEFISMNMSKAKISINRIKKSEAAS